MSDMNLVEIMIKPGNFNKTLKEIKNPSLIEKTY